MRQYGFYKRGDDANIIKVTAETFYEGLKQAAEIFGVPTSQVHYAPNFDDPYNWQGVPKEARPVPKGQEWRPEPDLDF